MTPPAHPLLSLRRPRLTAVDTATPALASMERILGLTLTLVFTLLCVIFWASAGGLWRDEANSVSLVRASLGTILRHLDADSFPVLWLLLLRGWTGFAHSDPAVRALGLITSLCVPAALVCHARATRTPFPYWAFLLLGLNPIFIRAIGSTRAYGLGIVLTLLASAACAQSSRRLTPRRAALFALLALLCVQCLYYNILFVGAMCVGAILVARRRGDTKSMTFYAGVWVAGAASLLPYLPTIARQHDWSVLVARPVSSLTLARVLGQALGADGLVFVLLWVVLLTLALRRGWTRRASDTQLYAFAVLCISIPGYWLFLKILRYQTSPWYWATLMALAAVQMETLLAGVLTSKDRVVRVAALGAALLLAFPDARCAVSVRQTGMDFAANYMQARVRPGDLVLVNPWYYGASFGRYYSGAWNTVPAFAFHRYGGMDEMKRRMTQSNPVASTFAQMDNALRAGHTVWLVGDIPFVVKGEKVRVLPPAPASPAGWNSAAYRDNWGRQAQAEIVNHGAYARIHEMASPNPINALENPQVEECRGWHSP